MIAWRSERWLVSGGPGFIVARKASTGRYIVHNQTFFFFGSLLPSTGRIDLILPERFNPIAVVTSIQAATRNLREIEVALPLPRGQIVAGLHSP